MFYRLLRGLFYRPDVYAEINYLQRLHSELENEIIAVEDRLDYLFSICE